MRALTQEHFQFRDGIATALCHALHLAVIKVADKSAEVERLSMVEDEAAESDALNAAFDEKVNSAHS